MSKATSVAWKDYRRARNRAITWILVFLFISPAIAYVSVKVIDSTAPGFIFAVASMMAAFYFLWQFITWSCPRCGETFGLFRHCRHCRLLKWEARHGRDAFRITHT